MMPCGIASRLHPPCLYFYLHALRIVCMFFFLLNIGGVILLLTHRSTAVLFGGGMGSKRSLRSLASSHLNRQIQTAQTLGLDLPHETDAGLNEMDYFGLAESLFKTHGVPWPRSQAEFIAHVPKILTAWREGEIVDGLETYQGFCARISSALTRAAQAGERVLVVTSAGVISTLTALALDLEVHGKSKI